MDLNIKNCVGKTFIDSEDGTQGKIKDIVKEQNSNMLCFSYCDKLTNEIEYMWAETSVEDDCITWSDGEKQKYCQDICPEIKNIVKGTAGLKNRKAINSIKPSYTYELVPQKHILEPDILPDGQKRNRFVNSSNNVSKK